MGRKSLIILLLAGANILFSCSAELTAKRKLKRNYNRIESIIAKRPHLASEIGLIKKEIITLEGKTDTIEIYREYDSRFDSTVEEFVALRMRMESLRLELGEATSASSLRRPSPKELQDRINILKSKENELLEVIRRGAYKDTVYTYSDSLLFIRVELSASKANIKYQIKDRNVEVTTEIKNLNLDASIRKNFWQDWKFWVFVLILILIWKRHDIIRVIR
jgi:hypothetical protein